MNPVGKKYIIEIEAMYGANAPKGMSGQTLPPIHLYRVKGFNSLVFDDEGLKRLEELDEDALVGNWERGYKQGLNEAWNTARTLHDMDWMEIDDLMDGWNNDNYFEMPIDEAMQRLKKYEERDWNDDFESYHIREIIRQFGKERVESVLKQMQGDES